MERKDVCDIVMKLFLYADMCKMIHYSTDKMHCHELCDDVRDTIMKFADDLAEQSFGEIGKPSYSDFTLKHSLQSTKDISQICKKCVGLAYEFKKKGVSDSMKSLIDDFCGDMRQKAYLGTFDNISNTKIDEAVNKIIERLLKG